jgi:hypothetical protein
MWRLITERDPDVDRRVRRPARLNRVEWTRAWSGLVERLDDAKAAEAAHIVVEAGYGHHR